MKLLRTFSTVLFILSLTAAAQAAPLKPGDAAPEFQLADQEGNARSISSYKGKYVVLEWFNQSCQSVIDHYESTAMQGVQEELTDKGVVWLSVISAVPGKPGYSTPAEIQEVDMRWKRPVTLTLLDIDGSVGKAYGAQTTPHVFVVNPQGKVIYAGAIDDKPNAKQEEMKQSKNYVKAAIDEARAGKPVSMPTTTAYGCPIKY